MQPPSQGENLRQLARVWGYAKYTHVDFLTGESDWDGALIELIPQVRYAQPWEVVDILNHWLDSIGYGAQDGPGYVVLVTQPVTFGADAHLDGMALHYAMLHTPYIHIQSILNDHDPNVFSYVLSICSNYLSTINAGHLLFDILYPFTAFDLQPVQTANLYWVDDFPAIAGFGSIPVVDRSQGPVYFMHSSIPRFTNQSSELIDHASEAHRLLGLFRLWNVVEYFFPYKDLMDHCWHALLLEYIDIMLDDSDKLSYELTLMSLAAHTQDAHTSFPRSSALVERFGSYTIPARITEAEGYFVIAKNAHNLSSGDIILTVDGRCIDDVAGDILNYIAHPGEQQAFRYLSLRGGPVRQHFRNQEMVLGLRHGDEYVYADVRSSRGIGNNRQMPRSAFSILDGNIGLINPGRFDDHDFCRVMYFLADTDGIIIDLRHYPSGFPGMSIPGEFFVEDTQAFFAISAPIITRLGEFTGFLSPSYVGGLRGFCEDAFLYDGNVVLLMNEGTVSFGESLVMALSIGENVTTIGTHTIGSNGNVTILPLPGGIIMRFGSLKVTFPDGRQSNRIGLAPDIYVERTVAGVRDGIDEQMAYAIDFLTR